jgi:hypothetical protein
LPLNKDRVTIRFNFNGADGAVSQEQIAKNPAARSCKKVDASESEQFTQGIFKILHFIF